MLQRLNQFSTIFIGSKHQSVPGDARPIKMRFEWFGVYLQHKTWFGWNGICVFHAGNMSYSLLR